MKSEKPFATVKQIAEKMGYSEAQIRLWCRNNQIPAQHPGRSWQIDVEFYGLTRDEMEAHIRRPLPGQADAADTTTSGMESEAARAPAQLRRAREELGRLLADAQDIVRPPPSPMTGVRDETHYFDQVLDWYRRAVESIRDRLGEADAAVFGVWPASNPESSDFYYETLQVLRGRLARIIESLPRS